MLKTALLIIGILFMALPAQAQIRIFVFAEASADGFVDSPRSNDSVRDLREIISKRKGLALAETKEASDIVLEVMTSGKVVTGTQAKTETRRGIFGGVNSNTTVQENTLPNLTVMLRVRGSDYAKELSITDQRFWKDLAKNIVAQTEQWLKLNGAQLDAIRKQQ